MSNQQNLSFGMKLPKIRDHSMRKGTSATNSNVPNAISPAEASNATGPIEEYAMPIPSTNAKLMYRIRNHTMKRTVEVSESKDRNIHSSQNNEKRHRGEPTPFENTVADAPNDFGMPTLVPSPQKSYAIRQHFSSLNESLQQSTNIRTQTPYRTATKRNSGRRVNSHKSFDWVHEYLCEDHPDNENAVNSWIYDSQSENLQPNCGSGVSSNTELGTDHAPPRAEISQYQIVRLYAKLLKDYCGVLPITPNVVVLQEFNHNRNTLAAAKFQHVERVKSADSSPTYICDCTGNQGTCLHKAVMELFNWDLGEPFSSTDEELVVTVSLEIGLGVFSVRDSSNRRAIVRRISAHKYYCQRHAMSKGCDHVMSAKNILEANASGETPSDSEDDATNADEIGVDDNAEEEAAAFTCSRAVSKMPIPPPVWARLADDINDEDPDKTQQMFSPPYELHPNPLFIPKYCTACSSAYKEEDCILLTEACLFTSTGGHKIKVSVLCDALHILRFLIL
jgi:hypothetical protein